MTGVRDKSATQGQAISLVALKLDRMLAEAMKPGFFGRVTIECVIQDGELKSASQQTLQNHKFQ